MEMVMRTRIEQTLLQCPICKRKFFSFLENTLCPECSREQEEHEKKHTETKRELNEKAAGYGC
jgi:uncharacterized Zn finger protein (UPF0148 family)